VPFYGGGPYPRRGTRRKYQARTRRQSDGLFDQVLIPGLIDCHNHCSLDTTIENYQARMNDSEAEQTLRSITNLKIDLEAGVTTTRCLGDKHFIDIVLRKAVESGSLVAPRLFVATRESGPATPMGGAYPLMARGGPASS